MSTMYHSPLAFPVRLQKDTISVLDETRLPRKETYLAVRNLNDALEVLGQMKTRAFGQVLLFFYTCVLVGEIDTVAAAFKKTRPTFDFFQLADILKRSAQQTSRVCEAAETIIEGFDEKRRRRAQKLAEILPAEAYILTICNVNGELIYLFEALKERGKTATFFVSETRPYLQGTRLTLWELRQAGIPAGGICDNQAAMAMKNGLINCIITGSDRSNDKGDIINKVGTYAMARLARYFDIPVFVLTQFPRAMNIEEITIEERPQEEVFMWLDGEGPWPEALYPSFDITPSEFISGWIDISEEVRCT
jgi:methylthioribose-1-phosphate isomerase